MFEFDLKRPIHEFDEFLSSKDVDFESIRLRLSDMLDETQLAKARVDGQLREARTTAYIDNEYADREWYSKASDASKIMGKNLQKIQRMMGMVREKVKQKNAKEFERCFVDASKTVLDKETYLKIFDIAQELMKK